MSKFRNPSALRRVAAAAVSAAAIVPAIAPPHAGAGNVGSGAAGVNPDNEISLGNNRWHSWSLHNGDPAWGVALGDAIFYSYEPTDLVTSVYTDGWNDVDVRIDVNTWGTGVYGYVYCPSDGIRTGSDPNETCYRQWVKIDLAHAGGFNADQRKLLMCHEFGHTLGLRHAETDPFYPAPDDTCMRTLIRGGPGMTHPQDALFSLHAHDTVHLNALY